jgi:diaminopimelate decarboxylase
MNWFEAHHINYKEGVLHFADQPLDRIAVNEPSIVYAPNRMGSRYTDIATQFAKECPEGITPKVFFSLKCNPQPAVALNMAAENASIHAADLRQVELAIEAGIPIQNIQYTPVHFEQEAISFLVENQILITVASLEEIKMLAPFAPCDILIRFAPDLPLPEASIGFEMAEVANAFAFARTLGLNPVGLHQHLGAVGFEPNLATFITAVDLALELVNTLTQGGFPIKTLNLGGGIGGRDAAQLLRFPFENLCDALWQKVKQSNVDVKSVAIEPGRLILADSALLLATVRNVEHVGDEFHIQSNLSYADFNHNYLGFNNTIILPVLEPKNAPTKSIRLSGPSGADGEKWFLNAQMPIPKPGATIALYPAGAYAMVGGNQTELNSSMTTHWLSNTVLHV